jgi:uncharacterized protein with PIN domain
MRFLCDQMLGTLAKWLRLFGFDTFYANNVIEDIELLQIAKKEKRIIITRDKELFIRGKKQNLKVIKIESTDLDIQLKQVLNGIRINDETIFSRCSLCNSLIEKIEKHEIKNKVFDKIYKNNDSFWFCPKCDKIYWMGSHYNKIISKINEIKKNV